ncbi:hypothetical protein SAMN04488034_10676 [Salinimicrobium catena]|uniref:DUF4179 domain-containing protein n=1 Tax=Salinimicrobium catena TaxID=390640 RepID=A0A1H5NVV2_9FLAO|nr:hypothetical protein [Salinimicrobium catena]SDL59392.1 hypothetical protein SAMN04488140_10638 [Salinimicrobium catena]SEF05799.1 hypothetical protein SAMN04488034_10676 [Salinimicrobium catena]
MKTDDLKDIFDELDFDIAQPAQDHEERFRHKLRKSRKKKTSRSGVISLWGPVMAVAASFLLAFLIFQGAFNPLSQEQDLASVSPEMKQTQDFYASVIKTELENLEEQKTPETEAVIEDALKQLAILEKDYQNLKKDLGKSGQDNRVIYAMISNFQKRIDLLNTVLQKVETINTLKNNSHENNII